jgi:hypothetical protein
LSVLHGQIILVGAIVHGESTLPLLEVRFVSNIDGRLNSVFLFNVVSNEGINVIQETLNEKIDALAHRIETLVAHEIAFSRPFTVRVTPTRESLIGEHTKDGLFACLIGLVELSAEIKRIWSVGAASNQRICYRQ